MAEAFDGKEGLVITKVDCTDKGKQTCSMFGVRGFPTIKYITPATGAKGEDYKSGREVSALKQFVEETLLPCRVSTLENCSSEQKA